MLNINKNEMSKEEEELLAYMLDNDEDDENEYDFFDGEDEEYDF